MIALGQWASVDAGIKNGKCRDVKVGSKLVQMGPKWDKSGS